ncbi:hypothetical protein CAPTEDRAFT_112752 [Capitella teleta]|uniref:Sodium-dependent multivitamin transporter n=1 Tax=Capitella teleta TaxID=283909 RepID=R7TIL5_CAPTE|nr:hypothetical protein CAPTEDRAFT_112752 [Capitella teleta]|eukprot:ELT93297.1 hypothetical protein CAPTEDRAFT_112752 [Capitella teleta]
MSTTEAPGNGKIEFHWADFVVFFLSLVLTAGVGLFMSFYKRKSSNSEELLLASRSMHFIPVCLSLLASLLNATLTLGGPADIYFYGATGIPIVIAFNLVSPLAAFVIVPTFYNMRLTSAYEYLEKRFNYAVRVTGSFLFSISLLLFLAIVLYAPALAFSQVTSLSLPVAIIVTGVICTIYTMMGGIKAVIWTDTIQMIILIVGMIVLAAVGSHKAGGFGAVWDVAKEYGRDKVFEWDWDPRIRYTFWGQLFGQWVIYVGIFFSNQMMIQRYMTVSNVRDAQLSVFMMMFSASVVILIIALVGWSLFAYYTVDPLLTKRIAKGDQIVPLFLMDILGDQYGLPGLITAAVFAAALSSVSSAVNSLAAVTLEDFIKPIYSLMSTTPLREWTGTFLTTALACFFGLITIGLSFAAEHMAEKLIEATAMIWSIVGGPLAGVFMMGFFFPWANSAGALSGMIISLAMSLWLGIGGIMYKNKTPILPLRMGGNTTFTIPLDLSNKGCVLPNVINAPALISLLFQWRSSRFLRNFVCMVRCIFHWHLPYSGQHCVFDD